MDLRVVGVTEVSAAGAPRRIRKLARAALRANWSRTAGDRRTLRFVEAWGFIWIMLVLKIPLVALLWLVWYAVRATPEPIAADDDGDGGIGKPRPHDPRGPGKPRRRGPHGDPLVPAPPRTRTTATSRDRLPG